MSKEKDLEARIKHYESLKKVAARIVSECDNALYKLKWDFLKVKENNKGGY